MGQGKHILDIFKTLRNGRDYLIIFFFENGVVVDVIQPTYMEFNVIA